MPGVSGSLKWMRWPPCWGPANFESVANEPAGSQVQGRTRHRPDVSLSVRARRLSNPPAGFRRTRRRRQRTLNPHCGAARSRSGAAAEREDSWLGGSGGAGSLNRWPPGKASREQWRRDRMRAWPAARWRGLTAGSEVQPKSRATRAFASVPSPHDLGAKMRASAGECRRLRADLGRSC